MDEMIQYLFLFPTAICKLTAQFCVLSNLSRENCAVFYHVKMISRLAWIFSSLFTETTSVWFGILKNIKRTFVELQAPLYNLFIKKTIAYRVTIISSFFLSITLVRLSHKLYPRPPSINFLPTFCSTIYYATMTIFNWYCMQPQEKNASNQFMIPQLIRTTISGIERTTYTVPDMVVRINCGIINWFDAFFPCEQ